MLFTFKHLSFWDICYSGSIGSMQSLTRYCMNSSTAMAKTTPSLVETTWIKLIVWSTLSNERLSLQKTVTWVLRLLANIWLVSYMASRTSHHLLFRRHELRKVECTAPKLLKALINCLVVNWSLSVRESHQRNLLSVIQTDRHMGDLIWQRLIQILICLVSARERHRLLLLVNLL